MTPRRAASRRISLLLLAHLALGAALTVGVAWSLASFGWLQSRLYQTPWQIFEGWSVYEWCGVGMAFRHASPSGRRSTIPATTQRFAIVDAAKRDPEIRSIYEEVRGWPWPCLAFRVVASGPSGFFYDADFDVRGGVVIAPMHGSFTPLDGFERYLGQHRALPLLIEPIAFMGNTIVWAAGTGAVCALALALIAWKRRARVRRQRCIACGYDRREASSERCPECGHATGARLTLLTRGMVLAHFAGVVVVVMSLGMLAVWKTSGRPRLHPLHAAARAGDIAAIDRLLSGESDVNLKWDDGSSDCTNLTPLMWAARAEQTEVVQHLLERGADVNAVDSAGNTALHWAALRGAAEAVPLLLVAGSDLEAKNNDGLTTLACAILGGPPRRAAALRLMEAGADLRGKFGGVSLLFWSAAGNDCDLTLMNNLLDADPTFLDDATDLRLNVRWMIQYGRLEALQELAARGCDVATISRDFMALAAGSGNVKLVQYLIDLGVPLTEGASGHPFQLACTSGSVEMARLLMAHGCDPLETNSRGETILYWGVWAMFPDMAQFALSLGVDVNARANDGSTALMSSAGNGVTQAVRLLLEGGADPLLKDNAGQTALDYALRRRTARPTDPRPEMIALLKKAMARAEANQR